MSQVAVHEGISAEAAEHYTKAWRALRLAVGHLRVLEHEDIDAMIMVAEFEKLEDFAKRMAHLPIVDPFSEGPSEAPF